MRDPRWKKIKNKKIISEGKGSASHGKGWVGRIWLGEVISRSSCRGPIQILKDMYEVRGPLLFDIKLFKYEAVTW